MATLLQQVTHSLRLNLVLCFHSFFLFLVDVSPSSTWSSPRLRFVDVFVGEVVCAALSALPISVMKVGADSCALNLCAMAI